MAIITLYESLSLFKPTGSRASRAACPGTWGFCLGEDLRVSSCPRLSASLLSVGRRLLLRKSRPRDSPMEVPIGVHRGGGAQLLPESRPRESPMEAPNGVCQGGGAQRNEMKAPAKMMWTVLPGTGLAQTSILYPCSAVPQPHHPPWSCKRSWFNPRANSTLASTTRPTSIASAPRRSRSSRFSSTSQQKRASCQLPSRTWSPLLVLTFRPGAIKTVAWSKKQSQQHPQCGSARPGGAAVRSSRTLHRK